MLFNISSILIWQIVQVSVYINSCVTSTHFKPVEKEIKEKKKIKDEDKAYKKGVGKTEYIKEKEGNDYCRAKRQSEQKHEEEKN